MVDCAAQMHGGSPAAPSRIILLQQPTMCSCKQPWFELPPCNAAALTARDCPLLLCIIVDCGGLGRPACQEVRPSWPCRGDSTTM
jgi:hypothetical protein